MVLHFGHASFNLLFFFGYHWHGTRKLFRVVFVGIDPNLDGHVEFGAFQMLGYPLQSSLKLDYFDLFRLYWSTMGFKSLNLKVGMRL